MGKGKKKGFQLQQVYCPHGINPKFCHACNKKVITPSPDQQAAINEIISGNGPFFLMGSAGTGKSFVINYLQGVMPRVHVTATTGAAAQLIHGRTLHSYACIHPHYGVRQSRRADERVRSTKMLVVDESSMMTEELLRQVYMRFQMAGYEPKLLLVGDFLQLPPVEGTALFNSSLWGMFKVLKLKTQHRQNDESFIAILGDIRAGNLSERVKKFLAERTVTNLPDDCTHLMAHRDTVERQNTIKLAACPGQRYCSKWRVDIRRDKDNEPYPVDLSKSRFVENLYLKEKARVVLLTNEPSGMWVNGSTGCVVKVAPGNVTVRLDNGRTVGVGKEDDEILNEDGVAVATIRQYPMMLGFGLTIHRAQGMTIDRVGVDLRGHFAPGQTYTALSRCKTAEGLFVIGSANNLIVDPLAIQHCA